MHYGWQFQTGVNLGFPNQFALISVVPCAFVFSRNEMTDENNMYLKCTYVLLAR